MLTTMNNNEALSQRQRKIGRNKGKQRDVGRDKETNQAITWRN